MQRLHPVCIASLIVFVLTAAHVLPVAAAPLCFPERASCVDGRFRQYWEQHGGLAVFGFATTAPAFELNRDRNQRYETQWFERNRLELHPENAAPYDMLLGRLGDDRLRQLGRDWRHAPAEGGPQPHCLWFAQTRHNVCDQAAHAGFQTYWQRHGLEFDGQPGFSYAESLALWGLPLTTPQLETNASGDTVLTQWFERARFEWHPQNPAPYRVLLGLLGNETRSVPSDSAAPATATPTAQPEAGTAQNELRERLVTLVNELHVQAGCKPLRRDPRLDAAAQSHAADIAAAGRIDHVGSDGAKLTQRLGRVSYPYGRASESIAVYQTPEQVVAMWMNEPPDGPHRRNITECAYVDFGVGLAVDAKRRHWWVMDVASQRAAP